uniref:Putative ovule protein n=1 Tax=Solanum chacoense TaxID=4108 RepID=A0A0V0GPM7_SOLCH
MHGHAYTHKHTLYPNVERKLCRPRCPILTWYQGQWSRFIEVEVRFIPICCSLILGPHYKCSRSS